MTAHRDIAWVGIDVGKTHHWACMVDAEGKVVSSIKVANDEAAIVALITDAGSRATQLVWAIDIIGAPSALLLALLASSRPVGALCIRASRCGDERGLRRRRQD